MPIEIRQEDYRSLAEYASISIRFEVQERVIVAALVPGQATIPTSAVAPPWTKDYDIVPDNDPRVWSNRFNVRSWKLLAAYTENRRVGGAIVATKSDAVKELGGRSGWALLWDLRVAPDFRRCGVGRKLLAQGELIAREAEAQGIEVETQDINVPACRLYAASGYQLRAVGGPYPEQLKEAKLLWAKPLVEYDAPSG